MSICDRYPEARHYHDFRLRVPQDTLVLLPTLRLKSFFGVFFLKTKVFAMCCLLCLSVLRRSGAEVPRLTTAPDNPT